jgi:hypothetical protein
MSISPVGGAPFRRRALMQETANDRASQSVSTHPAASEEPTNQQLKDAIGRIADVLDDPERIDFDTGVLEVSDLRLLLDAARETNDLRHDLERQMTIANIECNEAEKQELKLLRDIERLVVERGKLVEELVYIRNDRIDAALATGSAIDEWNPGNEDPYWMLEVRHGFPNSGAWLKNDRTFSVTRDAIKALRFPSRFEAYCARNGLPMSEIYRFEPTEHMWMGGI